MSFMEIVMNTIHLPNNPNLFVLSVTGIVCFSIALFFFLVSWAVGGTNYKDIIGGNFAFVLLVGGGVVSTIFASVTKPEK